MSKQQSIGFRPYGSLTNEDLVEVGKVLDLASQRCLHFIVKAGTDEVNASDVEAGVDGER